MQGRRSNPACPQWHCQNRHRRQAGLLQVGDRRQTLNRIDRSTAFTSLVSVPIEM
jgi:hypothetical protein